MTYNTHRIVGRYICMVTSGRIFEISYGGVEKFTSSFSKWLVLRGFKVILMGSTFASIKSKTLTLDEKEENKEYINEKREIKILNPPYFLFSASRFIQSLLWTIKIITTNRNSPFWIIHSQDTGYSGLAAIVAGKILHIPVILTSHGIRHRTLRSVIHGRLKDLLMKIEYRLDLFTVRNASNVIAVSQAVKEYLESISGRTIDFIPIGINTSKFRYSKSYREEIRHELGINSEAIVIGYVGRFSEEKNLDALIDSFSNVTQNISGLSLVLVGAGGTEARLKKLVKSRRMEHNVIFCGIRYDIEKILSSIDIFVLPSFTEGFSTSLLEAMACSRAIICSNIDANRAVISHNKNGLLIDPSNTEEIQQAMELLSLDSQLRCKLGITAKQTASSYDEETVFSKILQLYLKVS